MWTYKNIKQLIKTTSKQENGESHPEGLVYIGTVNVLTEFKNNALVSFIENRYQFRNSRFIYETIILCDTSPFYFLLVAAIFYETCFF